MDDNQTAITVPAKRKRGKPRTADIIPIEVIVDMYVRQKMSCTQIAKTLNISYQTVSDRLGRNGISTMELWKKNRADMFALKQKMITDSITEESLQKANLAMKIMAFGTYYDKERLERGLSTSNVSMFQHVIEDHAKSWSIPGDPGEIVEGDSDNQAVNEADNAGKMGLPDSPSEEPVSD